VKRLGRPPYTCLVTRGDASSVNFEAEKRAIIKTIREAGADGISMVQVREKRLPTRMLFELVTAAVQALAGTSTLVLVNDRADVAMASGADGLHLPGDSISARVVRRKFASDLLIGVSTHSLVEAKAAVESGADYIFFGPVFETPGKDTPVGLTILKDLTKRLGSFPVLALGGIDEGNFSDAISAGAAGIAAIRSLNKSESRRVICAGLDLNQARAG
jgi:thiamine-phosphate pyrophosphorylase